MNELIKQWIDEITADIEHAKRTFNQPEPPKQYIYGDGTGVLELVVVERSRPPLYGDGTGILNPTWKFKRLNVHAFGDGDGSGAS